MHVGGRSTSGLFPLPGFLFLAGNGSLSVPDLTGPVQPLAAS